MIAPRSHLTARTRLTLWYVLLLMGTQLVLGSLLLWQVASALYANADELLSSRAAAVEEEVDLEEGRLTFDSEWGGITRVPEAAIGLDVVRIWDASLGLVFQQESMDGLPAADPDSLATALEDVTTLATIEAPDDSLIRLFTMPVRERGEIVGVVQVGYSLSEVEVILAQLRLLGIGGLIIALLVAVCGGHFLAGRALAPVDSITRMAQRLSASDLSLRLNLELPDDELGRLAQAFDSMIDRLDRAFHQQRRFTADASHELRTPLAIVRSQVEMALGRPREPQYDTRVFASVQQEVERVERLVESLLLLARADAGQLPEMVWMDLEELIAEAAERSAPRMREQGIQFTVHVEETASVRGAPTLVSLLLSNLLDNAARHTPADGLVTLVLQPAPGGVDIQVSDTGPGIEPEHRSRIFERFYRSDRSRTRAAGGSGLGLAICEWIAQAHGGRLSVDSEIGRGTTFTLSLPTSPTAPLAGGLDRQRDDDSQPVTASSIRA